ncbi:MAG: ATP-binding protein [Patescibacteria group bacterium]
MRQNYLIILLFITATVAVSFFAFWQSRSYKKSLVKREKEMQRKMYELAILKELGDRIGYSLNIQKIVDIITGSLQQFIEFAVVSYMLLQPEKIIFKVHLEESVSRIFVDDIRDRMLNSLSALLNRDFKKSQIEEILSGAILIEEMDTPVRSFFNIPLVIGDSVEGVLTVSHTKTGLYKEEETTILYKITKQASRAVTQLHEVIETEQRKLNAMVESITEGVVMTDKDFRILVANPAARKVVGIEEKGVVNIFNFIDNLEGKFDILGKLEESVKLDKVLEINEVMIGSHYYQIFVSPVKSKLSTEDSDVVLGGVVIFHDITNEKQVERIREDFTSMIVHELRSPLNGINKMAEYIKSKKDVDKQKMIDYLDQIYRNSSNMLGLVNDLLGVAKLESGKFEIDPTPSNLNEIINQRAAFYKPVADDKKIELMINLSDDLPEKLNIDKARIAQVLNNLISNAIKFTDPGGKITLAAFKHLQDKNILTEAKEAGVEWQLKRNDQKLSQEQDSVIVAVIDNGKGVPNSQIPNLFNKYVQFKSASRNKEQEGTGLGLAIAKGIVEVHKGKIGAISEEGVGSTFYFTLLINNNLIS